MTDKIMSTELETSVIVPEVWSANFYDTLLADLPFNSIVSRDYEGEIQQLGDTVKISTVPEFSDATILPEGARNDADAVVVTQQNLVINKNIVKDFILTKKSQKQSIPIMDKLRDLAIYSIMKKIQEIIIELTVPAVANQLSYTTGTTLVFADILAAKEKLDDNDVDIANRHGVMGSAQTNDVLNQTNFTSSDFITSGAPVITGQLPPALLGFAPHFTTVVGDTSYWFHNSYFTMAAQQGISVSEFDLGVDGQRADRVNVGWLGGFKQLDEDRVATLS